MLRGDPINGLIEYYVCIKDSILLMCILLI